MRRAGVDTICLKAFMRKPMAKENIATLTSTKIAKYRDQRLKDTKPNTVVRELAYFSSIINHARREWCLNTPNPVLNVRSTSRQKSGIHL